MTSKKKQPIRFAPFPKKPASDTVISDDSDNSKTSKKPTSAVGKLAAETSRNIQSKITSLEEENKRLSKNAVLALEPARIEVTKYANRKEIFFKTEEFHELIEQIESEGQLIAIGVRASTEPEHEYQLVYGRRRLEACKELGIKVKAVLLDADDKSLLIKQYLENKRADLSYFEESDNLILMKEDGFFKNAKELAASLGISEAKVSQLLGLKSLPNWIKDEFLTLATENPETGFVEIDIAPLRSVRNKLTKKFKELDDSQTEIIRELLQKHKDIFLALPDWPERIDFILDLTSTDSTELIDVWKKYVARMLRQTDSEEGQEDNNKTANEKQKPSYYIDSNYQIGERKAGVIKASADSGISVKIDKRFYSKNLADELSELVNSFLEERFGGKNNS